MYDWPSFIPLPAKPEGLRDGDAHVMGDLVMCLYIFVALAIVDKVVFKLLNYFPTDGNGRYFSLHVLINAYVTAVHAKDVYATYTDPHNSGWLPCDNRGIVAIAALHIYHCVAYQPLAMVDIVHHVTMIGLGTLHTHTHTFTMYPTQYIRSHISTTSTNQNTFPFSKLTTCVNVIDG